MRNLAETKNAFVPLKQFSTSVVRTVLVLLGGVGFVGLGAHLDIPMIPVPMSMQTYAVVVVGALAGWRLGGLTLVMYLAAGSAGAPLFAGGGSGTEHLLGNTGGYLLGFVLAAISVGYLAERSWTQRNFGYATTAMLFGHLIILVLGTLWLATSIGLHRAIEAGMTPFLLGALVKSLLAAVTVRVLMTASSR